MRAVLWRASERVAEATLTTDSDYAQVAHAPVLVFEGVHYVYTGIFDGAVHFEETVPPACVDALFERVS